jgi:hypothetical protein
MGSFGRGGFGDRRGRGDEGGGRGRGDEGGGRGRGPGGRGGFGDPSQFIARLDRNGDGTIGPDEVDERGRRFFGERFQIDFSRPVRVEDVRRRLGSRDDRNSRGDNESEEDSAAYRVEGADQHKGRKSFRIGDPELTARLPSRLAQRDRNGDGQVTLGEFMVRPSDRDAAEFRRLDSNRDGIITAREAGVDDEAGGPDRDEDAGPDERPADTPEERTEEEERN